MHRNLSSILFLALAVFSLLLTSCDKGGRGGYSSSSYGNGAIDHSRSEAEIKMDLETRERMSPLNYLSSDGTYRKNLIGEYVLEGTIQNSATLATYKDVKLKVVGYSKTKAVVSSTYEMVYEYIKPQRAKSFKIKIMFPREVKSVGWDIVDADAI